MKKTPSVFLRNPENMSELTNTPNPEALWVFAGEGVATRNYDGTCVYYDGKNGWWARREVKKNKPEPPNWVELDTDPITGKRMGWEPIDQSGYKAALEDALVFNYGHEWSEGTHKLCGPKINGNSEGYERHDLIKHADAEQLVWTFPKLDNYSELYNTFSHLLQYLGEEEGWEGVVWHHEDGRMAKLKVSDFKS